ncbi:MAG: cytochrome P450 [Acidimicrobiia bacterium]|nr:cytochrome P450 [Acidimicrobiia bacterium]
MARDLDLLAGDFYTGPPYADYAWMREHAPAYWDRTNELWGITRYDDIVEIEKRKDIFVNSGQEPGGYRPNIPADASIIGLDDPRHTVRRNLVARRFTPRRVSEWEPHVRAAVAKLLDDAMAHADDIEVIGDLAAPLPAMMIGHLLGFPDDDWRKLARWSERTIALGGGPRYHDEEGIIAAMEFAAACAELYDAKRAMPGNDVMSRWIEAEAEGLTDGSRFGVDEIISDCLLLLDGGAETTRTVIARSLLALIDNPDQWAALRDGADLDVAVEELIRWVTPIHNMCRLATSDHDIDGTTIPAGAQVVLLYASANRDPTHFDDPERLDITRTPNHHLSFGFGTHFCLGASLARLEIKVFFEDLLSRVSGLAVVEGTAPVEQPNAFVYGVRSAHLRFESAR